ncbi:unnamed protein product [Adineta steineri]|uniref:MATH domain-containing protein n=1 Tax=Adineta steineri TaxID=433720 RepID=A0A814L4E5_9BILA|nr:unnamed protein product [Adineta steineri]CAF1107008.1 unnamed protein product [Adineta steineri]CAF1227422.1 unnamed protein product [Adineta steineri]
MSQQEMNEDDPTEMTRCVLHTWGCKHSIPRNSLIEHYTREVHIKSIINFFYSLKLNHETALIDLAINPLQINELVPSENALLNNYPRCMKRLTDHIVENFELTESDNATTVNGSLTINSNMINIFLKKVILDTDRNSDCNFKRQSLLTQSELNEKKTNDDLSLTDSSEENEDVSNYTESQQEENSLSADGNTNVQHSWNPYTLLQTQLNEMPISTDGNLVWRIDGISKKIDDAICGKQPYIDSPYFQTCADRGHRLRCRVYLNGETNLKSISLKIHLNFPIFNPFCGIIKFILVDRSKNRRLQHIIKSCTVNEDTVNTGVGFDNFIDKNVLHGASSQYIHDDSVCFLIRIEQTNEQKFANLNENIKDALLQSFGAT